MLQALLTRLHAAMPDLAKTPAITRSETAELRRALRASHVHLEVAYELARHAGDEQTAAALRAVKCILEAVMQYVASRTPEAGLH